MTLPRTSVAPQDLDVPQVDDVVYAHLREQIVRGLEPGTVLRLADTAELLGVSTMPVRAALQRLESDGLVQKLPRRGAVVAPLSMEDLEEIQAVRFGIEAFAARLGVERMNGEARTSLKEQLLALQKATRIRSVDKRTDTYLDGVRGLHRTCYSASGRDRLMKLVQNYEDAAERYIRFALRADGDSLRSDIELQEQFVDACLRGEPDVTEQTVRRNLQWTIDICRPLL